MIAECKSRQPDTYVIAEEVFATRGQAMASNKLTEISAILGEDFYALIDALGVREAFDDRRCTCDNCQDIVDIANVLLVFPKWGNQVAFLCTKPSCTAKYAVES